MAAFSDVVGEETRHSIGLRRSGTVGKRLKYNTEFIYQFGDLDGNSISAFNFETDWSFALLNTKWWPIIGLKLDWSTGDKAPGDGKLNSFNPLFVNPATYSLAVVNTPVNLLSFHPSVTFFPGKRLFVKYTVSRYLSFDVRASYYLPGEFEERTGPSEPILQVTPSVNLIF